MSETPTENPAGRPDLFGPIISLYAQDLQDKLTEEGRPVGRTVVSPGDPAWDDCCKGTVYARIVGVDPQINQPAGGGMTPAGAQGGVYIKPGSGNCGILAWTVTISLGVLRCAATQDNRGRAPKPEKITEDGLQQIDDMQTIADVILSNPHTRGVMGYEPFTPEGGCVGGEWQFSARVNNVLLSDWTSSIDHSASAGDDGDE